MKLSKLNRILHRDIGFIFFGMTIIYAISGIALNHIKDWNPSYHITNTKYVMELPENRENINKEGVLKLLSSLNSTEVYKKHYYPNPNILKIFVKNGSLTINVSDGNAVLEKIRRRPILYEINKLHYNPGKWWTIFSDIFSIGLLIIAITGLFITKGKNGMKGRGGLYTLLGILIPLAFLFFLF